MRVILPAVAATAMLGAVLWQVGCDNDLRYVSSDRFAAEYAQALCTSLQPCCQENGVSFDYQACAAGWEAAAQTLLTGPSASGNYNVQLATSCIQQVRDAQSGSCQPIPGSLSAARDTCQSVFAGTLPLGAPCTAAGQCAPIDGSVVTCAAVASDGGAGGGSSGGQLPLAFPVVFPQGVTAGGLHVSPADVPVCVEETPSDAGNTTGSEPCTISTTAGTDTCITMGEYCDPTALTCTPQAAAGGGCDPAVIASCQAGNYCTADGTGGGSCVAAGGVGGACTSSAMCDSTGFCNTTTKQCEGLEAPGTSCTSNASCTIGVCDTSTHTCLMNAIATTQSCNGQIGAQ